MKKEFRQFIRKQYKIFLPEIIISNGRISPYSIHNWASTFTPIENNMWGFIRFLGLKMYPQFPISKYFIDFADPIKKIGIEVDGKEYHKDLLKDEVRQNELENLGWIIYRFSGRETYLDCELQKFYEFENEDDEQEKPECFCVECQLKRIFF